MVNEELLQMITRRVMDLIKSYNTYKIPIGISNRHIHLSQQDLTILFGKDYRLTKKSDLKKPGQYACNETVTIRGPKGEFDEVRILAPVRSESQIEISKTDSFRLGIGPSIRESKDLCKTPGLEVIGPAGTILLPREAIIALRHIHMNAGQAKAMGVKDKDIVEVETYGQRQGVFGDVLIRVSDQFSLEMHIDADEANACALANGDYVLIRLKPDI